MKKKKRVKKRHKIMPMHDVSKIQALKEIKRYSKNCSRRIHTTDMYTNSIHDRRCHIHFIYLFSVHHFNVFNFVFFFIRSFYPFSFSPTYIVVAFLSTLFSPYFSLTQNICFNFFLYLFCILLYSSNFTCSYWNSFNE